LYKINGIYYHFFSRVTEEGRVMMMERSKNIYGPWEIKQLSHVNKSADREPNQGGLMQLKNGQWWFFTHHGSGDWEGRMASLLPVTWVNGWPIIGKVGADTIGNMVWSEKMPINIPGSKLKIQTDDDFSAATLLPQWEWNYQPRSDKWSLSERKGFLRLHAFQPIKPENSSRILLRAGNTITQRSMRTRSNIATVKLDISGMSDGQFAGLTHFSTANYSQLGVKQNKSERLLVYSYNDRDSTGLKVSGKHIWLRSEWDFNGKNRYFYSLDGKKFLPIGNVTQLTWASYRGDRVGVFNYNVAAEKGYIDVDSFKYQYSKEY
jgi:beta-xylosidase